MAKLFSDEWMNEFAELWNADEEMIENLNQAGFTACIGFGCKGDDTPRGVVEVMNGRIAYAGSFSNHELDWDMRAEPVDWKEWISNGFGLDKLGISVSSGKLEFSTGDYRQMIRNPNLAKPFLRHFELMSQLKTDYK